MAGLEDAGIVDNGAEEISLVLAKYWRSDVRSGQVQGRTSTMVFGSLKALRTRIIASLVSDDELMELLVLKGGNAVDLVHGLAERASLDLDFSLPGDFPEPDVKVMEDRFRALLERGLAEAGYTVLDVKLEPRPETVTPDLKDFWGGYLLTFKVIAMEAFEKPGDDERSRRMRSEDVGPGHRKNFRVDFSKHEYCVGREPHDIEGYRVWVYTPAMIVCEKLRAICQQMPEYRDSVKSQTAAPRARDFFDIHILIENAGVELSSPHIKELLCSMFEAKRVPLHLLGEIKAQSDFHRDNFASLKDVINPGTALKDFDYYVDYVVDRVELLKPFGVE